MPLPLRFDEKHSIGSRDKKETIFLHRTWPINTKKPIGNQERPSNLQKIYLGGTFVFQTNPKTTTKVMFQNVAILSGKNHKSASGLCAVKFFDMKLPTLTRFEALHLVITVSFYITFDSTKVCLLRR